MHILMWVLRALVFLLLLGFAVKNSGLVTVQFFFGAQWQVSMVILMLGFFAAGALIGVLSVLSKVFRQRREISRLQRAAQLLEGAGRMGR
jgi:uncharacterized integral membrane protein